MEHPTLPSPQPGLFVASLEEEEVFSCMMNPLANGYVYAREAAADTCGLIKDLGLHFDNIAHEISESIHSVSRYQHSALSKCQGHLNRTLRRRSSVACHTILRWICAKDGAKDAAAHTWVDEDQRLGFTFG